MDGETIYREMECCCFRYTRRGPCAAPCTQEEGDIDESRALVVNNVDADLANLFVRAE